MPFLLVYYSLINIIYNRCVRVVSCVVGWLVCWLFSLYVQSIQTKNPTKKSNKKIQPTNKTYELIYLRENCKKWTFMPILMLMSIFYITIRANRHTFAAAKQIKKQRFNLIQPNSSLRSGFNKGMTFGEIFWLNLVESLL